MSLLYFFYIQQVGYFNLGRMIDLFQMDLVIVFLAIIAFFELNWWRVRH